MDAKELDKLPISHRIKVPLKTLKRIIYAIGIYLILMTIMGVYL